MSASRPSAHDAPHDAGDAPRAADEPVLCDVCGFHGVVWQKCKLVCTRCGAILLTCGDL
ncbi:MAG TPA: hypothetical protein VFK13_11755 [Gemmatimonadaceae bacterium]|nr:hypothetical protein [Gemmatimonadaceae bacterium]